MNRAVGLVRNIQYIFLSSLVLLCLFFMILQFTSQNSRFQEQAKFIRHTYLQEQKDQLKREVDRAVQLILAKHASVEKEIEDQVRVETYRAYAVAENLYLSRGGKADDPETRRMIIEALRPVRYDNGLGYLFITSHSGLEVLFSDRPQREGENLLNLKDSLGNEVIRDMIRISETSGEGFYRYRWTKPGAEGENHPKISFVKHFAPYDWIIGTGLYLEDKTQEMKRSILAEISKVRFGEEGYIFVNTLDGHALVSNGEVMTGEKKLWEVFDPASAKELFNKELAVARVPQGGYIYYDIRKLSDASVESPKVSFVYGLPELNWLIGAGVYLDDVEAEIRELEQIIYDDLLKDMALIMAVAILITLASLIVFRILNLSLQRDFHQFSDFFEKAFSILQADFMDTQYAIHGHNMVKWKWNSCFAHTGLTQLGAIEQYQCGVLLRIQTWLKTLGIRYTMEPEIIGCLMHTRGACEGIFRFYFDT